MKPRLPEYSLLFFITVLPLLNCGDYAAKSGFNKAKELERQQKFRMAIEKYEAVARKYPNTQFGDSARIASKILTSPQFISDYVRNRLKQGIRPEEALGEFSGLKIIWLAKPIKGCVRKELEGQPIEFRTGTAGFLGIASYGMDALKFKWFCTSNEEQLLTIEGSIIKATTIPELPLVIGVNAIARQN